MSEDKSSAQHTDEVVAPELHTEEVEQDVTTNDVQTPSPTSSEQVPESPINEDEELEKLLTGFENPAPEQPESISRRDRAKEKDISRWTSSILDTDGNIDTDSLKAEYARNPRGLEDFATKNNFDINELLGAVRPQESESITESLQRRLAALEKDKLEATQITEKTNARDVFKNRLAEYGLKPSEFSAKYKAEFDKEFSDLHDRGFSQQEATEKALRLTVGQDVKIQKAVREAEVRAVERNKNALLPKSDVGGTTQLPKVSRDEFMEFSSQQRIAYTQKHGKREGGGQFDPLIPQFK